MRNLITVFIFIGLAIPFSSCEAQNEQERVKLVIEKHAAEFLGDSRVGAVSIGVLLKGKIYTHHEGELDPGQENKPTNQTLYQIASVTKTMTGYLVAQAVKEGKISLDDEVSRYLGSAWIEKEYDGFPVRIKHLITHTSGLPLNVKGVSELYEQGGPDVYRQARDFLTNYKKEALFEELKITQLTNQPGVQYGYSNVAPNLVAHILEQVYNTSFEDLLKTYIIDPAGMTDTHINLSQTDQERLANGYNDDGMLMPNFKKPIQLWGAAGRAKSKPLDMMKYATFLLDPQNEAAKMSMQQLFYDVDNIWIGYYWEMVKDENGLHAEHHGGLYGTQNWLLIYPQFDLAVSVITNRSFPAANQLIKQTALGIVEDLKSDSVND